MKQLIMQLLSNSEFKLKSFGFSPSALAPGLLPTGKADRLLMKQLLEFCTEQGWREAELRHITHTLTQRHVENV